MPTIVEEENEFMLTIYLDLRHCANSVVLKDTAEIKKTKLGAFINFGVMVIESTRDDIRMTYQLFANTPSKRTNATIPI